jgi:hypothetical protein
MEWAIPLQKLELGKVQIGNIKNYDKMIAPLAYFDGTNTFNNLNIILPKLKVQDFDPNTGKLILSLKDHKQYDLKLSALQSTLLGAVFIQQKHWFPYSFYDMDTLNSLFNPIIINSQIHLYFPNHMISNPLLFSIKIYKNGVWYSKYEPGLIETNSKVRIMFRIQGISFHKNNLNQWSGKFRFQHRIVAILVDN